MSKKKTRNYDADYDRALHAVLPASDAALLSSTSFAAYLRAALEQGDLTLAGIVAAGGLAPKTTVDALAKGLRAAHNRCITQGGQGWCPLPPLSVEEVLAAVPEHLRGAEPTTSGKRWTPRAYWVTLRVCVHPDALRVLRYGSAVRAYVSDAIALPGKRSVHLSRERLAAAGVDVRPTITDKTLLEYLGRAVRVGEGACVGAVACARPLLAADATTCAWHAVRERVAAWSVADPATGEPTEPPDALVDALAARLSQGEAARCAWTTRAMDFAAEGQLDHLIPQSAGGRNERGESLAHDPRNVVFVSAVANRGRGDMEARAYHRHLVADAAAVLGVPPLDAGAAAEAAARVPALAALAALERALRGDGS